MTKRSIIRLGISAVLLALFTLHTARLLPARLLDVVEFFTYDARLQLTLPGTGDPRVVILDLDERSLSAEGWPLRRDKMAQLVETLFDRYGARVLGFDILFSEPDDRATRAWSELASGPLADLPGIGERDAAVRSALDYDRRFADAIAKYPVVMGFFFKPAVAAGETASTGALCEPLLPAAAAKLYAVDFLQAVGVGGNLPVLQAATPHCGFFENPIVDEDGVFRRVPLLQQYQGALYPSLALAVTRLALGEVPIGLQFEPPDRRTSLNLERLTVGELAVPVDGDVAVYVPYRGNNRTFTYVSVTDVIRGTVPNPEVLKDAIVLMGASAAGLLDLRSTPVNKVFIGVEVHANIVSGILDGRILQKAPYYNGIELTLLLVIALLLAWAFSRLSSLASAAVVIATALIVIALGFAMWLGASFIMPMGTPVAFTFALFMAHLLYGYFVESRGKREISKLFGQYIPPELVEEMAERPEAISMEGESREMTVLFSDVRGFTTISEKLEARELAALMNAFLTKQTAVVHRHRGTIDKYMGDAIMAFWGAPLPDADSGVHALEAALDMIKAVRELDADFAARGWPRLDVGVGLSTGKMNVGNMGSEFRMAYTVMGDTVNLGSRLEGLTKEYGVSIICSQATRDAAPSDWAFRELDLVCVKGKQEPVAIYEPLGPKERLDPGLRQDLARHRGAMQLYRAQKWDEAEMEFFNLQQGPRPHRIYTLFVERIMFLRENPPGRDWDGAFTFTHK
jgi:adenylate cyclase